MDFADAVAIAARAYGDSRDRSADLFLAHGLDVAQALGPAASPTAMKTAVLHDILEDTDWTLEDLARFGVEPVVCEAIDVLTRRRGETYMDHIRRICAALGAAGDTARLVKVADLKVGSARTKSDALRERYEWSLPLVEDALVTPG